MALHANFLIIVTPVDEKNVDTEYAATLFEILDEAGTTGDALIVGIAPSPKQAVAGMLDEIGENPQGLSLTDFVTAPSED